MQYMEEDIYSYLPTAMFRTPYNSFSTNPRHFSKLSNINLILNFKQNLIEVFKCRTNVLVLTHAIFAKELKSKDDLTKKRIKREKREKDIIKHKGYQKTARINKMLINARFSHISIKLLSFFFLLS